MKINNFIKISLLTILMTVFLGSVKSYAQTQNQLFNLTNVEKSATLGNPTKDQYIILPPFTIVTIPPGAFTDKVYVYVYKGNFDAIKNAISPNSPISSYYLVFGDSNSKKVYPKAPIKIKSVNNFVNSDTYLYALNSWDKIGSSSQKFNGHVTIDQSLPLGYYGFIVAASTNIQKDNSALSAKPIAKKVATNPGATITTQPTKTNTSNSNLGAVFSGLLPIVLALIVVVILIVIVLVVKKRSKPTTLP